MAQNLPTGSISSSLTYPSLSFLLPRYFPFIPHSSPSSATHLRAPIYNLLLLLLIIIIIISASVKRGAALQVQILEEIRKEACKACRSSSSSTLRRRPQPRFSSFPCPPRSHTREQLFLPPKKPGTLKRLKNMLP
eukprot:764902-Hanusia_phi.AAC.2